MPVLLTQLQLDETYQVVRVVEAVETRGQNLRGDIHEFHITAQDTALMTVYYPQPADLSPLGGPRDGWVLDSIFQEVDLETGGLIFEWRASEHIPLQDSMRSYVGSDLGNSPNTAFDYFHVNSVDKDHLGNYIISARHSHQVVCISPEGDTLWVLGGKSNMFQDLSNGRATGFSWQHHARWHGNNTLTLFDNAKTNTGGRKYAGDHSRGLVLALDTQAMTVTLIHDYYDPEHPKQAESQGSMQITDLDNNVLVDYGFYPAVTEFSKEGKVLCDVRLAPWLIWKTGMVTSYRGFKTSEWIGRPWYNPVTSLSPSEGVMYVSWNGATEVASWVLQGSDWNGINNGNFEDLDVQAKDGFESSFVITDEMPQYLRIAAVDQDGAILKASQIVDRFVGNVEEWSPLAHGLLIGLGVLLGIAVVVVLVRRRLQRTSEPRFSQQRIMSNILTKVRTAFAQTSGWSEVKEPEYSELQTYEDEDWQNGRRSDNL